MKDKPRKDIKFLMEVTMNLPEDTLHRLNSPDWRIQHDVQWRLEQMTRHESTMKIKNVKILKWEDADATV